MNLCRWETRSIRPPLTAAWTPEPRPSASGASGEYLFWWFKNGRVPPLVTAGGDGKLGSPGTRVLVDSLDFDDDCPARRPVRPRLPLCDESLHRRRGQLLLPGRPADRRQLFVRRRPGPGTAVHQRRHGQARRHVVACTGDSRGHGHHRGADVAVGGRGQPDGRPDQFRQVSPGGPRRLPLPEARRRGPERRAVPGGARRARLRRQQGRPPG